MMGGRRRRLTRKPSRNATARPTAIVAISGTECGTPLSLAHPGQDRRYVRADAMGKAKVEREPGNHHRSEVRESQRVTDTAHKRMSPPVAGSSCLAGGLGFEPRLAESESAVLPLDDPPRIEFRKTPRPALSPQDQGEGTPPPGSEINASSTAGGDVPCDGRPSCARLHAHRA